MGSRLSDAWLKIFPWVQVVRFPEELPSKSGGDRTAFFPTPKACFLGLNVMKYDEPNVDLSVFFCMFI